jgi:preprotein translocase subunit SecE
MGTASAGFLDRYLATFVSGGMGSVAITDRIKNYYQDTRAELKRVVWPTRQEAIRLTLLVVAVTVALGIALGVVDLVFEKLVLLLVR